MDLRKIVIFLKDGLWLKHIKKSRYYQEDIYVWNDRTIQVNAIELNDTIYDLIKADLVVKVEE